jgi:hypothetical protein
MYLCAPPTNMIKEVKWHGTIELVVNGDNDTVASDCFIRRLANMEYGHPLFRLLTAPYCSALPCFLFFVMYIIHTYIHR